MPWNVGGIKNVGNTCYVSAMLQALIACPVLLNVIANAQSIKGLPSALFELVQCTRTGTAADPLPLLMCMRKRLMGAGFGILEQNDAYEFLLHLIDVWNSSLALHLPVSTKRWFVKLLQAPTQVRIFQKASLKAWRTSTRDESVLNDLIMGQIASQVECNHCHEVSNTFEVFSHLSIPCIHDVAQALSEYMRPSDALHGWKCDKCGSGGPPHHTYWFSKLPAVLIIVIKRYDARGVKKMDSVSVPQELELGNFSIFSRSAHYMLRSLVCHNGSSQMGHYTAIVSDDNGQWLHIDDEQVSECKSPGNVHDASSYIAVYDRLATTR